MCCSDLADAGLLQEARETDLEAAQRTLALLIADQTAVREPFVFADMERKIYLRGLVRADAAAMALSLSDSQANCHYERTVDPAIRLQQLPRLQQHFRR